MNLDCADIGKEYIIKEINTDDEENKPTQIKHRFQKIKKSPLEEKVLSKVIINSTY